MYSAACAAVLLACLACGAAQQQQMIRLADGTPQNLLLPMAASTAPVSGVTPFLDLPRLNLCGGDCPNGPDVPERAAGATVVAALQNMTADTQWVLQQTIPLKGQSVFHTEGMLVLDDLIYISAVEVLNRSRAEGRGWLIQFTTSGDFVDKVQLGSGRQYHPGGIDTDGEFIYVPVAEYHAGNACGATSASNCTLPGLAYMYKVTPDLEATIMFNFSDHLGSVAVGGCTPTTRYLDCSNWGSRTLYRFAMDGTLISAVRNQQAFVDFQDCKSLSGCGVMLCSGIKSLPWQFPPGVRTVGDQSVGAVNTTVGASYIQGGVALVDPTTGVSMTQVPVNAILTPQGNSITVNPVWPTTSFNGTTGLQFLFAPDTDNGSVVVTAPLTKM